MEDLNDILNLDDKAEVAQFKKGSILQYEGDNTSKAFYVKKGLLRSYMIDDTGKEHIFMFAPEGWIIADIESQEFNQPATLFIDCIEDSEVVVIERSLFLKSELNKGQLKKNANLLLRRVAVLQRRVLMLMSALAEVRYKSFLDTYPELNNRVPQHMIASYLGITPQALSTIRGKISKKIKIL